MGYNKQNRETVKKGKGVYVSWDDDHWGGEEEEGKYVFEGGNFAGKILVPQAESLPPWSLGVLLGDFYWNKVRGIWMFFR